MVAKSKKRSGRHSTVRYIGKPAGKVQQRVAAVGPEHFGVVSVDCAKRRSKWMLCDFYGRVIVEPTEVEHNCGALDAMIGRVIAACEAMAISDSIVAIEMTGVYHRPVQAVFRKAGFDTRTVHPFASKHYRRPLHPDDKTDDNDLEAIFHAAINGYGLSILPVDDNHRSLQALSRHRRNLVRQRARLQIQIRVLLHQTMPGYADLFEDDKLFNKSIALPVLKKFGSPNAISRAGVDGLSAHLKKSKTRFHARSVERIAAWSATATEPARLSQMLTEQWKELNNLREIISEQVCSTERKMAEFLVKTPYVLLLSVTGINVVSAAALAGEAGPIEHYATGRALTGRGGLFPSRYQSDEVDCADGALVQHCNRRLRGAQMLVAENLIKCHPYYRGLSAFWEKRKVDPRDRRVRVANRAMRMAFQIVSGRQVWRGKGVDREYLLKKLHEFHRVHKTPVEQTVSDMNEAIQWLPKSTHASEAQPLQAMAQKQRRGPKPIADLLLPLLVRLGVPSVEGVQLELSEARGSD